MPNETKKPETLNVENPTEFFERFNANYAKKMGHTKAAVAATPAPATSPAASPK